MLRLKFTTAFLTLTAVQYVALLSALLGLCGTIALFFGSYAFEPLGGASFNGPILQKWNARIKIKNSRRKIRDGRPFTHNALGF